MMNKPPIDAPDDVSEADSLAEGARSLLTQQTAWQSWLTAVQFLTRIPVPAAWQRGKNSRQAPALQQAVIYFPLVGTLIGLATGLVIWLGAHLWPLGVAVIVGLAIEALLTGALHEDALADFCDAFGGGSTREDVLRIIDDSRVGSYGALGLMLGVLLRAGALASIEQGHVIAAVMASATLGRWAMLWAMAALPPIAGRQSLAEDAGRQMQTDQVLWGGLLAVPGLLPLAWLSLASTALAIVGVVLLAIAFTAYVRRRIGGITGDCLGCLCYLGQLLVLLCCPLR
jgi:adenosylcobinamide-GDP ribazoletransferase